MVKYIIIAIFISQLYCDDLKYLKRSVVDETPFEIAQNILSNPTDNGSQLINIGFDFPFNATTFNQIFISSNGALKLGNSNGDFSANNEELPYKDNSIYPYWYDLKPNISGEIRYENKGDRFIINWENIPDSTMMMSKNYTFQTILYKNGDIRFRYDSNSDADGGSCFFIFCNGATIGVEESNNRYDQYSYKNIIDQTKDVLYSSIRTITKSSCVIKDPINGRDNPKRIPNATIRYALEVRNLSSSDMTDVIVEDKISSIFNTKSIRNIQIQNGNCDCLGVTSNKNNGNNGSSNGENPIKLDFGRVIAGDIECGYFEVNIK